MEQILVQQSDNGITRIFSTMNGYKAVFVQKKDNKQPNKPGSLLDKYKRK